MTAVRFAGDDMNIMEAASVCTRLPPIQRSQNHGGPNSHHDWFSICKRQERGGRTGRGSARPTMKA